jgi:hypothetical protein
MTAGKKKIKPGDKGMDSARLSGLGNVEVVRRKRGRRKALEKHLPWLCVRDGKLTLIVQ